MAALRLAFARELGIDPREAVAKRGSEAWLAGALHERDDALLVLDGIDALVADARFGRMLHELLSRAPRLRLLLVSRAPLPPHLSLPVRVAPYALGGLAPRDAAHLLATHVARPLSALLAAPSTSSGSRNSNDDTSAASAASPPPPATLDALAAEPLLVALRGHPADILRCAQLVTRREQIVGVRAAFEVAAAAVLEAAADERERGAAGRSSECHAATRARHATL